MINAVAERLRLSDFDYDLPESRIAQAPAPQRDHSRLMTLDRTTGRIEHGVFSDIEGRLNPGDLLVLNDTKVFPCRLPALKTGGGKAEIFLLNEKGLNLWDALVKGCGDAGRRLFVARDVYAEIVGSGEEGVKTVRFYGITDIRKMLDEIGRTPLPPYIRREADERDRDRYQTVYARHEGAVAAPTAGLHFTSGLLERLADKGVEIARITLHVGPGTFQPVRTENISEHRMHPESYEIPVEAAERINKAKAEGRRIIAVGTTSLRALETAAYEGGTAAGAGESSLFIYPGYEFRMTDGMITNFHLPKSTLLMLVSAFAGREKILSAYRAAIAERYRFYSYGDAMLIV